MGDLITVSSDTVDKLPPDLPRMVRLALGYGARLQRGTLDVRLPDANGLDLIGTLRGKGIDMPIIMVTGHGDIPMSVKAMKAGAIEFLAKPFRDQDLLDAIQLGLARDHKLRFAVKGGGHSYQGTSSAPDSLLIWTRPMHAITLHDAFVPEGSRAAPVPAVTVEAGAMWVDVYDAVTTKTHRYVQGGGCMTVGVAPPAPPDFTASLMVYIMRR